MLRFRLKTVFNPRQDAIEVKKLASNCQDPYRNLVEQQGWQGALESGELSYFRFSLGVANESEYILSHPESVKMVIENLGPLLSISSCSHGDFLYHLTDDASAITAHLWDHIFGIGLQFLFPGVDYVINLQELDRQKSYIFYQIHVVLNWLPRDSDQVALAAQIRMIGFFITRFFSNILGDEPEWYPINQKFSDLRRSESLPSPKPRPPRKRKPRARGRFQNRLRVIT